MKASGLREHGVTFRVDQTGGHFGVHLTLDGYGAPLERLNDLDGVRAWLDALPARLGMIKLADPVLVHVGRLSDKDPGGLTGFVLIAESHISIHTFPTRGFVSADVYTCQDELDSDWLVEHFHTTFGLEAVEHNLIIRGTQYPRQDIHEITEDDGPRRPQ